MPPTHIRLPDEPEDGRNYVRSPTASSPSPVGPELTSKWLDPLPPPVGDSRTGFGGGEESEGFFARMFQKVLPGPPIVSCIIIMELCERYGYYSLRSVLAQYLRNSLGYDHDTATSIALYSSSLAYFMPIVGGFVSDSYLGRYQTIICFGMVYCMGAAILAATAWPAWRWGCILALVFIGVGTGGIKPCVSSFGADQFSGPYLEPNSAGSIQTKIESYFRMFYFCINFGSVFSFAVTPLLRDHLGYAVAFAPCAVFLCIALAIFFSGRKSYYHIPPQGSILPDIFRTLGVARLQGQLVRGRSRFRLLPAFDDLNLAIGVNGITQDAVINTRALYRVIPIFAVLPVFWMLFEQQTNTWTFQATNMATNGVAPETLGVFNPIFIMILIPLFDKVIYPFIERSGYNFTALRRMGWGMIFGALAFFMFAAVQYQIDQQDDGTLSMFWQLPQILTISIAEILVSVTGLEFSYAQAPPVLKSLLTALFLITDSIGTSIAAALFDGVAPHLTTFQVAILFSCLMLVNWLVFLVVAMRFRPADPDELNGRASIAIADANMIPVPSSPKQVEFELEAPSRSTSRDRRDRQTSDYGV